MAIWKVTDSITYDRTWTGIEANTEEAAIEWAEDHIDDAEWEQDGDSNTAFGAERTDDPEVEDYPCPKCGSLAVVWAEDLVAARSVSGVIDGIVQIVDSFVGEPVDDTGTFACGNCDHRWTSPAEQDVEFV